MKPLKLLIYLCFTIVASASAATSQFQFGIGNANFAPSVNVQCDSSEIAPISVPIHTSAYTHVKYFSSADNETTCQFTFNQQSLGEITLHFVPDATKNNITGAFISKNTLNRKFAEIIQTNQEIYIYFKE